MRLTTEQAAAVASEAPHKRIIAVAGSGKTTLLVHQIGRWLATGSAPETTVAITFTRRAGETIRRRVLAERGTDIGYAGTIHGMAYSALALANDGVDRLTPLTNEECDAVVDHVAGICHLRSKVTPKVKKRARGESVTIADSGEEALATSVVRYMVANRIVHVSMLVRLFVGRLSTSEALRQWFASRVRTVLWDEYQDVDDFEARILDIVQPDRSFIVGDPRQAIYGFRGSCHEHLWHREAETWPITCNFRSGSAILDVANRVGINELNHVLVPFRTDAGRVTTIETDPEHRSVERTVEIVDGMLNERRALVHILCRTNHEIVCIDRGLQALGKWKTMVASPAFDRFSSAPWQRLFLVARYCMDSTCEWLASNAQRLGIAASVVDDIDLATTLVGDLLGRYSQEDASTLAAEAAMAMTIPEFVAWYQRRDLQDLMPGEGDADVVLMTAHASKGLEFSRVVLTDVGGRFGGDHDEPEETNLLYVGATRAMDELVLVGRPAMLRTLVG